MKKRLFAIDNLKGFLILLVILGHVTMGLEGEAQESFVDASMIQRISTIIYAFHMQVFFALSGYFWKSKRDIGRKERLSSVWNKCIALGIPYYICSILYFSIKFVARGITDVDMTIGALIQIPVVPIEFFWYLYSLCTVYVLAEILDAFHIDKRIIVVVLAIFSVGEFVTTLNFSLAHTFEYAVYFYIGNIVAENKEFITTRKVIAITGLGSILFFYLYLFKFHMSNSFVQFVLCNLLICFLIGSFSVFCNKEVKYISYIGRYSMPFYIMHYILVGATRILLRACEVYDMTVHMLLGFFLPTILCYVLYRYVISRISFMDFCFYPSRYITNRKAS